MLSVCIITKNEERKLEKCLRSLKALDAEIVVVDTGSEDGSPEVMKKYADVTGYFEWCDNFAKAKNYAASLASNDWILTIDSDEYVKSFDKGQIEEFMRSFGDVTGQILRYDSYRRQGNENVSSIWIPRLYHRNIYQYRGRIHEQLYRTDGGEEDFLRVKNIDLVIDHDGYEGTEDEMRRKAKRNEELLLLDLEEFGEKPYTLFQLGKSCYMAGEYGRAVEYFSRALEFDLNPQIKYVQDMVETYGYALINSNQAEIALGLESVYDTFAVHAGFVFMMGLVYMNTGYLDEAVAQFQKAATMEEADVEGVNSYRAYYNIGVIYECCGRMAEAVEYYKKCGSYDKAEERLRELT